MLAKFGFDTAENEPRKVCPLSVYRFLLLLQIPKVGEMLIAGPLHLGVPKSTPGSPSFEATHLVAESGRPGRPELLAKKGRIVGGVGCPPNCRTSGKLRGNFGEARGSSDPFELFRKMLHFGKIPKKFG